MLEELTPPLPRTNSAQPQDGTTAPRVRPPGPGFELLFPHVEWKVPYAPSPLEGHPASDSIALCPGSSPVRKRRIPYVQPVDSPADGDLGVSSAWGMEGMPAILMYAPERPLLSGAAGSTDAVPENLVLCVEEDAFERAWVAPQGYWGSVHARNGHA